jgi:acetyltransferase-like isoleucine patch superfamily enzyme
MSKAGQGGRLGRLLRSPWSIRRHVVQTAWRRAVTHSVYRLMFESIGAGSVVYRPGLLANTEYASLGRNVLIRYGARIEIVVHGCDWRPSLRIGNNVNIEQNVHIVCHDQVVIEDNVSITGHCAIVDVTHPISALLDGRKMGDEIEVSRSSVSIGSGTFIGFGSIVLPNVKIGRFCVIGAGSVVADDIPDYSIAAGAPARVIRRLERHPGGTDG